MKIYRSLQQKKFRDELGLFLAEGPKCVEELRSAFRLEALITEEEVGRVAIEQLSSLPGIGGKTAQRLAFHIINLPEENVERLVAVLTGER